MRTVWRPSSDSNNEYALRCVAVIRVTAGAGRLISYVCRLYEHSGHRAPLLDVVTGATDRPGPRTLLWRHAVRTARARGLPCRLSAPGGNLRGVGKRAPYPPARAPGARR